MNNEEDKLEQKQRRRAPRLERVALSAAIVLLLAACGGSGAGTSTTGESQSGSSTTQSENAETTVASSDPVEIEFWQPDTREPWLDAMGYVVDSFEEANPNVTVNVVEVPWGDLNTKVQSATATDTLPDVLFGFGSLPSGWALQEITVPVDDVIDSVGRDEFPPALLEGLTIDSQAFGVPLYSYPQLLWYRADWFEEAGLSAPTSWDELRDAAEALTDGERYGFITYNQPPEPEVLLALMATNDAYTFGPEGEVVIDGPNTVEALEFLSELYEFSPPGSMANSEDDARLAFQDGCCAMIISSPSFANAISEDPSSLSSFATTLFPTNRGDRGALAAWATLTIPRGAEHPAEAAAFLEHWFSSDVYLEFSKRNIVGILPVVESVADSEEYWASERVAPMESILRSGIDAGRIGVPQEGIYGPNACAPQVLSQGVWEEMGDRVTIGQEDPAEVAAWAQEQITQICESLG
ncbi:MAG: sugar ABC transporter substrate-binding protein [Acidimicrobiia bacterium]